MKSLKAELVIEKKTGRVRQAGASSAEGEWIAQMKAEAEKNLFFFGFTILGLTRLTSSLHLPVCKWLTSFPGYRKLLLLPRDHLKTSILRALALHIFIQAAGANPYFPGKSGSSLRILYAGETATNAEHQLAWLEGQLEKNELLRAFWPQIAWEKPSRDSKRWNSQEMLLPRDEDFPEASVETIGVGGAVTGRHYDILMKDDLISMAARKSQVIMQDAILWHKTSRALLDNPETGLEFTIGTHWAVSDLYTEMRTSDPSVECLVRAAIEDGQPIFPEMFSLKVLNAMRVEYGPLFSLIFMNNPIDTGLVDFDLSGVRMWEKTPGGLFSFETSPLDEQISYLLSQAISLPEPERGAVISPRELLRFSREGRLSI